MPSERVMRSAAFRLWVPLTLLLVLPAIISIPPYAFFYSFTFPEILSRGFSLLELILFQLNP